MPHVGAWIIMTVVHILGIAVMVFWAGHGARSVAVWIDSSIEVGRAMRQTEVPVQRPRDRLYVPSKIFIQ